MRLFLCLAFVALSLENDLGVSAKFRNLTGRKLRVFWVERPGATPRFNGYVPSCEDHAFASYIGHKFFWAEAKGPAVPLSSPGAKQEEIHLAVNADSLLYSITDDSSPPYCVEQHIKETTFLKEYRKRTGRHWLHVLGRPKPIFPMWPVVSVGQKHRVELAENEVKWLCADEKSPQCRGPRETLEIEVLSLSPRAFLVKDFLADWESEFVIRFHTPRMLASTTGNGENEEKASQRTSTSDRMHRDSYPLADAIYRRLARVLSLPEWVVDQQHNSEAINVVHYRQGQEYTPHYDVGPDKMNCRWISALMYFNTPLAGGNTSFPRSHIQLRAVKNSVLFFYDLLDDGNLDEFTLHAGEPVRRGDKWIGAAWIWDPYYQYYDTKKAREEAQSLPAALANEQLNDVSKPKLSSEL